MASYMVRLFFSGFLSVDLIHIVTGMSDSLTNYLVGRIQSTTPCVIKYVPYGALVEACICFASSSLPEASLTLMVHCR